MIASISRVSFAIASISRVSFAELEIRESGCAAMTRIFIGKIFGKKINE